MNILVDENGNAIITDFGLSKIIEEITTDNTTVGTSFFAGSTRWMAPELLFALIEDDDGGAPPITPASDVYAFASVCLEVNALGSCLLSPSPINSCICPASIRSAPVPASFKRSCGHSRHPPWRWAV